MKSAPHDKIKMQFWVIGWLGLLMLAGCGQGHSRILGEAPASPLHDVAWARQAKIAAPASIQGVMIEKCPTAGCWFMLRDTSGTIKVDTKEAGFVVVDVPLKAQVMVSGTIATNGEERILLATGLRY